METFGAKPTKSMPVCRDEVLQCDAMIVVVGYRYGWIPKATDGGDDSTSITWWEVRWALESGKSVYAFLADSESGWTGEREQDELVKATSQKDFVRIGKAVQQLQKFRNFLSANITWELFTSPDNLSAKVASSLHPWLVKKAVDAVTAKYFQQAPNPFHALPELQTGSGPLTEFDYLYWQEQIHLFSAHHITGNTEEVQIALIAGYANTEHPALTGASIKQLDIRSAKQVSNLPDDYTTALAALLVGNDDTNFYRGMVPQAPLLVLQVLDNMGITDDGILVEALETAIGEGCKIICLPLQMPTYYEDYEMIFRRIVQFGIVIVCGAGDDSGDKPAYPGAYPANINAGAVDTHNRLAAFSNFGKWVTITTPGVDIPVAFGNNRYQKRSGTSFSCGILAGAAALMLKVNPKLTPEQVKNILLTVGRPVLNEKSTEVMGRLKVLDVCEAVQLAAKGGERKEADPETSIRKS